MSISDISLTAGMRGNLISLQNTSDMLERTQDRLSTGKRINSPMDSPVNYFTAQAHRYRAEDIDSRKDGMGEAIQLVKAAENGVKSLEQLVQNAKGLTQAARSTDTNGRVTLAIQFDEMLTQINNLAGDASYKGRNLLMNDSVKVEFNESGTSFLMLVGTDATTTGLGLNISVNNWLNEADIDAAVADIENSLDSLRNAAAKFSSNLSVIVLVRISQKTSVNTLIEGSDNLTLADMNEESANMLMLQTRQGLGTTALSLSSDAAQSVLRLF